ncbi:MAG: NRDE family protein [Phycisphaerae bacterium]|nr:NRDE family protein [Phycisphaerae bacterium]
MCTVSVIRRSGGSRGVGAGIRLVVNRDEQRSRAEALPPRWFACGGDGPERAFRAIAPIDPNGGGTWVAANDRGLVLCVLNLNGPGLIQGSESRGGVIPKLIGAADTRAAMAAWSELDLTRIGPFRLLMIDGAGEGSGGGVIETRWEGPGGRGAVTVEQHTLPGCWVSSGLGDALVRGPRLGLFRRMVMDAGCSEQDIESRQDAFHAHTWPDRPHLSVRMTRSDARTVSVTTVEVERAVPPAVHMRYQVVPSESEPAVGSFARGHDRKLFGITAEGAEAANDD